MALKSQSKQIWLLSLHFILVRSSTPSYPFA